MLDRSNSIGTNGISGGLLWQMGQDDRRGIFCSTDMPLFLHMDANPRYVACSSGSSSLVNSLASLLLSSKITRTAQFSNRSPLINFTFRKFSSPFRPRTEYPVHRRRKDTSRNDCRFISNSDAKDIGLRGATSRQVHDQQYSFH